MLDFDLSKNHIFKLIRSLKKKSNRQSENCFLVEGEKNIISVINSNYELKYCIFSSKFYNKYKCLILDKNILNYIVEPNIITSLSNLKSNNAGIAIVKKPSSSILEISKNDFCIALDDISDPGNLGTIIRIADWFKINRIICSKTTVDMYNPKVIQAAMGSFFRINIDYVNLLEFIKNSNLVFFGAFLTGKNIHKFSFPNGGVLVIGNESHGISDEIKDILNEKITIPKYGEAESLNAAIATAIICDKWKNSYK